MREIAVGPKRSFKSLNEAISSVDGPAYITLDPGIYREKVVVNKPDITIDGGNKATVVYGDYATKIHEDGREYVTFRTYTMLIKAPRVTLKDLIIENDAGEGYVVGQAVALHLYADEITLDHCYLKAKQDTIFLGPLSADLIERYIDLLPEDERFYEGKFHHTLNNCTIEGTVDFIFGGSYADFNECTIISLPTKKDSWICAPNHEKDCERGFIFNKCRLIKGENTKDDSVYLARPWRDFGFVEFKSCYMDSHIKKDGFSIWEGTTRHLGARFYEEDSSGPGKSLERISWSHVK